MKNQYFQFFLRHWFLNLWRLINIWIWYLELAFIPLWLIRKKESDQIKIRKIILKLWVFELIWGKTFCSSFQKNYKYFLPFEFQKFIMFSKIFFEICSSASNSPEHGFILLFSAIIKPTLAKWFEFMEFSLNATLTWCCSSTMDYQQSY